MTLDDGGGGGDDGGQLVELRNVTRVTIQVGQSRRLGYKYSSIQAINQNFVNFFFQPKAIFPFLRT